MFDKWTDDEFPPDGVEVIVGDCISEFVSLGNFNLEEDCFNLMKRPGMPMDFQVTHWMFLPKITNKLSDYDDS